MAESIFWFRGFHRGATDAGSLAFHSACFCRLSVMLAYNVNLLVIPPEQARAPPPVPAAVPPLSPLALMRALPAAALTPSRPFIPPSQAGLSTEQTHFYCLFAKKSRLLLTPSGDKDFYLLVTPALLLLLYVAYQFDVLARLYQWGVEHRGWQV